MPHEYDVDLRDSDGTMIRNRSSHIPTMTPHEAITAVVIDRSLLMASSGKGITKLHKHHRPEQRSDTRRSASPRTRSSRADYCRTIPSAAR